MNWCERSSVTNEDLLSERHSSRSVFENAAASGREV